jgi:hypothetical protein
LRRNSSYLRGPKAVAIFHVVLPQYLQMVCRLSNCFIVIDEANDLDSRVWPYMKRIIDAGVPVVFAGLP